MLFWLTSLRELYRSSIRCGGNSGAVVATTIQSHPGAKRSHNRHDETWTANSTKKALLPLPRIRDVLAVNLLRLLEGAAVIQLHHSQQQAPSSSSHFSSLSQGVDRAYMLDRVESMAATEVLTEARSSVHSGELVLPADVVEDEATFYCNEKHYTDRIRSEAVGTRNVGGILVLLGPGVKMMLLLHLFELNEQACIV